MSMLQQRTEESPAFDLAALQWASFPAGRLSRLNGQVGWMRIAAIMITPPLLITTRGSMTDQLTGLSWDQLLIPRLQKLAPGSDGSHCRVIAA